MTDADDADFLLLAAEKLADGFGLCLDGASGCLLDEDVAILTMLEREEHKIDSFLKAHDETRHAGLGDGDGVAIADLFYPKGNH